ncbi:MAG: hypothetical protein BroJett022_16650 [Actinomycetes bacterium]|nr:MAG: hypothetical protein BroJett022_16650 [Actinomycetes bacterium]
MASDASADGGGASPGMSVRTRHRIAVVLVVIATLTGALALLSTWVKRQLYDTDQWVETSSALLADETIRSELANFLTAEIFASGRVREEVAKVLPPKAEPLAGPASAGLSQLFNKAVNEILQTSFVQNLWEEANRKASEAFIAIANDEPIATGVLGEAKEKTESVNLDLTTIRAAVTEKLGIELPGQGLGSGEALQASVEAGNAQAGLEVIAPDEISTLRDVSSLIEKGAVVLLLLTFALYAVAISIARGMRLRTLTSVGLSLIVVGLGVLTARSLLGTTVVDSLVASDSVKPAATAAWDISTELLQTMGQSTVAYGLVALVAALLAGGTRWATWIREHIAPALRDPMWAAAGTALVLLILVWWGPTPGLREPLGILLIAIFVIVGVVALRRQVMREFPSPGAGAEPPGRS